ncbi:DNA polymerase III subunit delta' [Aciduricibacillus chroicocephali]|uniref:DNA polymerase III subunit delta n=1 Tax=Aciduricibacillus chroicocephali TaxID=3054939 RepID=A0ABY9KVX3_9BACI|nr:DNA polymerase III subunit delta' [Bacillaceae bacterium 44XB]
MKTWSELGEIQPLAARILENSIKRERLSHAYLIAGARGTGKEALALLLAQTLFCTNREGTNPCGECSECRRITSHNHPDVHWIEPDGQSIKIEQIRHLQKEFIYSGVESSQKAYIIKGAETLTVNAANRILKFLEEPSRKTTAIMLTENAQAMLATIRSRCQIIELKPLDPFAFSRQLQEAGVTEGNAKLFSELTNNLQEAMDLNENEAFAQQRKLVVQWVEMLSSGRDDSYLFVHQQWLPHLKDRLAQEQGLNLLLLAFRDIHFEQIGNQARMALFQPGDERLERAALSFNNVELLANMQAILQAKRRLTQNIQPTLVMEQLALQLKR